MENISRRRSDDEDGSCTATSMYLSFDAESTMSTACYKTLEAMTDISAMSIHSIIEDDRESKNLNITLENEQGSEILSPPKTVKKLDVMAINSPLRALPKNVMREYKAMCSTPSKEQLLKTVEVTRGSDVSKCMDLGVAFLGVEDGQPAFFSHPVQQSSRNEDKENTMPENVDGSNLSISSSAVEKRMLNSASTTGSLTGDESESAISVIEKRLLNSCSTTSSPAGEESMEEMKVVKIFEVEAVRPVQAKDEIDKNVNLGQLDTLKCTLKGYKGALDKIATINEDYDETPNDLTPKAIMMKAVENTETVKFSAKPKIAVLTSQNVRRSVCEPNLPTNKLSRISVAESKRKSLLPITQKKTTVSIDAESEIPVLMSRMLKITNAPELDVEMIGESKKTPEVDIKSKKEESIPVVKKTMQPMNKRRSVVVPMKSRTSLMPSSVGDKRPFSFTHRMSVVVKTTLNSPARKLARRSALGTGGSLTPQQRRSLMATKSTQTMRMNKQDTGLRRSLLPSNKNTTRISTNMLSSLDAHVAQENKLVHSLAKVAEERKITPQTNTSIMRPKVDTTFSCNVCQEKFRVKYLLEAHKRTHDSDTLTTPIMKKPTPTINSAGFLSSNPNQCKYCDKKFALVRALHIHLLQNCSKIPPSEKRKLEYTEMNHVEKAPLPSVFHHGHVVSNEVASTTTKAGIIKQNAATQKMIIPKINIEAVKDKDSKRATSEATPSPAEGSSYPSTNTAHISSHQKPKKAAAHSGVYRTPSKTVPCHICKLTFKNILDYTNHSLETHGSKAQNNNEQSGDGLEH